MDAAIFKAEIRGHHDEIREAMSGTVYSGHDGNLRKQLLAVQSRVGKTNFSDRQRHIIQDAVFPE